MKEKELVEFTNGISNKLNDVVFNKIYLTLLERPAIRKDLCPAFPFPLKLRIGILKDCFAVEYIGPGDDEENHYSTEGIYQPTYDIYDFLGLDFKHLNPISISIPNNIENMSFFLGDAVDYLTDYFYDFTQMPSDFQLNGFWDFSKPKQPTYVSNTTFFWTDNNGKLEIKHIDFLELFPLGDDGNVWYHDDNSLEHFADFLIQYKVPTYRVRLHGVLNEFIELINLPKTTEPEITTYLTNNPEILQLAFGVEALNPQVLLEWQYDKGKNDLQPDFLPIRLDGYADIMEFKLPFLKGNPLVGVAERNHPSYEIDTAIAQLETYEEWCSQEINTLWLEKTKGIKILFPKRYLIIGHSKDFSKEDRARLRNTRDTLIYTYDEFIERMRYQIYRVR